MKLDQIMYAAVKPDGTILGDGGNPILHYDKTSAIEDGKEFAEYNGVKPEEVRIAKVRLVEFIDINDD